MSILKSITKGRVSKPPLILLYGPDGVGKTAFAAGAPNPLFLGAEAGTNHLDVSRLGITSLPQLRATLTDAEVQSTFQTLVLDTADWMETLVYAEVLAKHGKPDWTSIEDFGFGKGRVHALEAWKSLLVDMNTCRDKGMGIIILAHSLLKKFEDPTTPQGYERYQLKLQAGAGSDVAGLLREYVDTVLFMNFEVATSTEDKKRAFGDGSRVLHTQRMPAFDAKNRFGLPAVINIPDDPKNTGKAWAHYASVVAKAQAVEATDTKNIEAELLALADQITDPTMRNNAKAALTKAQGNASELSKLKTRLLAVVSKGKEKE